MKKLNLTILSIAIFLLASSNLSAQNNEGRFNLNVGDWFKYRVDQTADINPADSSSVTSLLSLMADTKFAIDVSYQLQKQDDNGNQFFKVEVERIRSKVYSGQMDMWFGYDSFYPPFTDEKRDLDQKHQFLLGINPNGEIFQLDTIHINNSTIQLSKINAQKKRGIAISYTFNFPIKYLGFINSIMAFKPAKSGHQDLIYGDSDEKMTLKTISYSEKGDFSIYTIKAEKAIEIGQIICLTKERLTYENDFCYLIDASFPLPGNTVIKGKLNDQINKEITIGVEGDRDEIYFQKKHFITQRDGSFECRLFIDRPYYLKLDVGNESMNAFIEPNDTLVINQIEQRVERVSHYGTLYDHPTQLGYLLNTNRFEGKAAYNAKLSVEMDEWLGYPPAPKSVEDYLNYQETTSKSVNQLFSLYKGKASESCINFLRLKWEFFHAADKLYFKDNLETTIRRDLYTAMKDMKYKQDTEYPMGFYADVDTLSTVMHPYEWCKDYQSFLDYSFDFKKERLEMQVGGLNNDFYNKYYFARSALKGYPLYKALSKILDEGLRQGCATVKRIEPYYQDFINNCTDPVLTEPLIKVHSAAKQFEIGEKFPIESVLLKDSSQIKISDYKGKPVCLFIWDSPKSSINHMKNELHKFKSSEVEFVFVVTSGYQYDQIPVDTAILSLPNLTIVELADNDIKDKVVANSSKIFVLDRWLRLIDDNVDNPLNYVGSKDLEETIRKAIEAERFTKDEKASMYKTGGWSLGSILFTLMIGLWFYSRRVQKLKREEALKRQIKELEIKAIRSQMNPHFIFNSLNSIQSLVNAHHYKETNIYLAKFSVLLRGVLNNSEKGMVSLSDELEAVKLYCELEQLRFEFDLVIEIAPEINADLIEVPGMIIQPLAENAVVHGLASLGSNGVLTIKIENCANGICVSVTDNGAGLVHIENDKLSEKGFGLKLINERLTILSHKNFKAKFKIENNKKGKGTTATLFIPID
ncbi:sensor histidine kinase [Carboxylicivirga caseinilyticus]|uniref:sensor histidine kinase n=1 Tax=Carboxylicivirga caseinilyticus TaxID=3417572 RepID=UPI003D340320|nr:histidine kinase [Marinilabiliaceae bacterium A049]